MASAKFSKVLVVRTDRIGDVVLTTPALKALRQAHPHAHICVLLNASTVDLVQGNPYVNEVLVDDRRGRHRGPLGFLRLARDIRRRAFDTAFVFHTKRRYNLACFFAGIPQRWGFKNNKFGVLLTRPVNDRRHLGQKHEAEYCLDLLQAAGISPAGMDLLLPVNKDAEAWAAKWFGDNGLFPQQVVALHPGASDPAKQWPAASFAGLAAALGKDGHFKVLLIGGPETVPVSAQIAAECPAVLDLTGRTSLAQMASLLRRCRLLISNDSGPMHVGAAAGACVIGLFLRDRPGINPGRWRPLGPRSFMAVNEQGISVEEVLALSARVLSRDNQSLFYW